MTTVSPRSECPTERPSPVTGNKTGTFFNATAIAVYLGCALYCCAIWVGAVL